MTTSYDFTLTTHFPIGLNTSQLHQLIMINTTITTSLNRIDRDDDDVHIIFDSSLSAPEETELNTIITNYVYQVFNPVRGNQVLYLSKSKYQANDYETVTYFMYPGKNHCKPLKDFTLLSYMDSTVTSYTVRIYDSTNHAQIGIETFTNEDEEQNTIEITGEVPYSSSTIEVQVMKNGGILLDSIHINSVQVSFA